MNTVIMRVETELDPSAAPRVFGYLGGLGHVPVHAVLRRAEIGAPDEKMVMEVHFESPVPAAERISAKIEQMPFVLQSCIAWSEPSAESSGPQDDEKPVGAGSQRPEGMGHSPAQARGLRYSRLDGAYPTLDATALRFAAAQRGHAIRHRAQLQFNA